MPLNIVWCIVSKPLYQVLYFAKLSSVPSPPSTYILNGRLASIQKEAYSES